MTLKERLQAFATKKEFLKTTERQLKKDFEELKIEEDELFEAMMEEGFSSVAIDSETYYCRLDRYMSAKNKAGVFGFLKEHDLGELIQPTVNARTLTSELIRLEEDGIKIPLEYVSERVVRRIGIRKKQTTNNKNGGVH